MKTLFLLIMLTRNGAGDINASFVTTETQEQCHQKELMVDGVFKASNIPVILSRCIPSDLRFSGFGHSASSGMTRYFYLVRFDDEAVQIKQMPDWPACMAQAKQGSVSGKSYCSSSVQSLLNPG